VATIGICTLLVEVQETRARTLHLAEGNERNGVIDTCAVIDVSGRYRLVSAAEDMGTTVSRICISFDHDCDVAMAYSVPWLMHMPVLLILAEWIERRSSPCSGAAREAAYSQQLDRAPEADHRQASAHDVRYQERKNRS
jgi:hypothetical protein